MLRDYQKEMLTAARLHMHEGRRKVLLVAPTGAGKRLMIASTIARMVERGKRCAILVHRRELLDQTVATIEDEGMRPGVIKAGEWENDRLPIQVASVASLVRRLDRVRQFDYIFHDEAHHAAAASHERVVAAYPEAFVFGYTATPARLDGKGLAKYFDAMVVGPSVRELIDAGYLADYRLFAPPGPDVTGVRTLAGDYHHGDLAAAVDQPKIVGDAVSHYWRHAAGSQAICFAVNISHSKHLATAFRDSGITSRHIDATTPKDERAAVLADFADRRFQVLCNVDILGEGLDVAGIETVICCRPTKSLTMYLQQIGRGLRVKPGGARAIILDHAGNTRQLGLPDDERNWELTEDRIAPTKGKDGEMRTKVCPSCSAAVRVWVRTCPECGEAFVVVAEPPPHGTGELGEVYAERIKRTLRNRMQQGRARDFNTLVLLGKQRGYHSPHAWASHVLRGRKRG